MSDYFFGGRGGGRGKKRWFSLKKSLNGGLNNSSNVGVIITPTLSSHLKNIEIQSQSEDI